MKFNSFDVAPRYHISNFDRYSIWMLFLNKNKQTKAHDIHVSRWSQELMTPWYPFNNTLTLEDISKYTLEN